MTRKEWDDWRIGNPEASEEYGAAFWVANTSDKYLDETEMERDFRQLRKDNLLKFHEILAGYRDEYARSMEAKTSSASGAEDIGTDKAIALCEEWIKDWNEKNPS